MTTIMMAKECRNLNAKPSSY